MSVKTAASIYTSTFLRNKLREKFLTVEEKNQIIKLILDVLFMETIPDNPRIHLKIALEQFYCHDPGKFLEIS